MQAIKPLITKAEKSSKVVGRETNWMLNYIRLLIKSIGFWWFSVYHLAFDQLLDGAHQLRSTGCLRTGRTH